MTQNIEIGGKSRPINLGRNALRDFEKITGKSILNGSSLMTFEAIQVLFYCGLKWGLYKGDGKEPDPEFNLIQIGDWLDEETQKDVNLNTKIFDLLTDALPKKEEAVAEAAK
jgi:hypothetical protein